mgnify:CR=1 FL=1
MIDKNSIRSVDRTIDVLETFIGATGSLKVSEIETATGINLPTLYRIMNTLERRHFIRPAADPTRYELDYGIIKITSGWLRNQDVVGRIEPLMQELAETTKETVAFNLYRDRQRICVREIPSQQAINFTRGVGTAESLLYGASGKAILAFENEIEQKKLVRKISKSKQKKYLRLFFSSFVFFAVKYREKLDDLKRILRDSVPIPARCAHLGRRIKVLPHGQIKVLPHGR